MDPKVQVFGWLMLAPFLVFTVFAFRTFLVPARAAAGPGLMLGALSMFSGITLAVWEGRHGTYQPVLWALGAVLAISAILLYELARRTVTGRGFYSVMSGAVPGTVCAEGPYRYIRHPVYTSYILAFLGLLVAFPGLPTAIAFAANIAFYLYAASDEERTLAHSEIGQAYASYRQGTGMFFPRVGR
jgi:protein-S-isoprenylcysteine O-methyltransferase Ste14